MAIVNALFPAPTHLRTALPMRDGLPALRRALGACLALARSAAHDPEAVAAVAEAERVFLSTLPLETTKVDPFLVASTAHLSDAEQRRLAAPVPSIPQPFILVAPAVHGAVLYLDADAVIVPGVLSAGAEALARYMQRHGFDYVYLDADVEPVVGVPVSESHAA